MFSCVRQEAIVAARLESNRQRGEIIMAPRADKVVGYFAFSSETEVVCTGELHACVISASVRAMNAYLSELDPDGHEKNVVKKTRFGEILRGLKLGAAYAFDRESYKRFRPLAQQEGLPVAEADFDEANSNGLRFFTVQLK